MNAILKVIDRFRWLFEKAGIEYEIMRKILEVKFKIDSRRVPTLYQFAKKPKKEGNYFFKSLWLYILFGLIATPFAAMGGNYIYQMTILFSFIFFILFTAMLADYSSVLLDIRDRVILHTKPIKEKTISAAKTVHVSVYMFFITIAFAAIPLIVGTLVHGPGFAVIFVIELILVNFLTVFITALIYLAVLRFFDGEKLKDFINYVQIAVTIGMTVGYQIVVRSFEIVNFHVALTVKWWHYLLPPFWYAAPYEWFLNGRGNRDYVILTILGLVVPLVALFLYTKSMRIFERSLQKLAFEGGKSRKTIRLGLKNAYNLICFTKEERMFFRFAGRMMKKERNFKLRVYPALGFSLIFPFVFLFNDIRVTDGKGLGGGWLTIYACLLMIPSVVLMLNFSGKYKGAWVFKTAPLNDFSSIFKGTLKAFLVKLFLPIYLLLSLIYLWLFGMSVFLNLVAIFITAVIYTLISFKVTNEGLPFSKPMEEAKEGGIKLFLLILGIGIFVAAHYKVSQFSYGTAVYTLLLAILAVWLWRKFMNVPREKIF